jgi:hypothetical protein
MRCEATLALHELPVDLGVIGWPTANIAEYVGVRAPGILEPRESSFVFS